jgi:hypothetical protein
VLNEVLQMHMQLTCVHCYVIAAVAAVHVVLYIVVHSCKFRCKLHLLLFLLQGVSDERSSSQRRCTMHVSSLSNMNCGAAA